MRRYLAPMEGITGYIFRSVWTEIFGGADCLFTPFLSPNQNFNFTAKERNDILPEHNARMNIVPQILANRVDYFLWAADELERLGYTEVNLNLGCPSGTVVAKRKGAGLLAYPDEIDRLLEQIFAGTKLAVSVKTRLGCSQAEEFAGLLPVFNRYPLSELIIHPRVQKDFYQNTPDLDWFGRALAESTNPVCYNGDIVTAEDARRLQERFPRLERIMCGRGVLANPALLRELAGGKTAAWEERKLFHDRLYEEYRRVMPGEKPTLFKMKELWNYWYGYFSDPIQTQKRLRRVKSCAEYEAVTAELFKNP